MLLTTTSTLTALTALLGFTSAQWAATTPEDRPQYGPADGFENDLAIIGFHTFDSEIQNLRVNLGPKGQGTLRFDNTMASTDQTWSGNEALPQYLNIYKAYIQCAPPNTECELRAVGDVKIYGWTFDQCSPLTNNNGIPRIIGVNCYPKGTNDITSYAA